MARVHGKSAAHYVDEFDLRGVTNNAVLNFEVPEADATAFSDDYQNFLPGKPRFQFVINGFFSTASPNYDGEMFTDLTSTQRRVGVYPGGPTEGNWGYEGRSNISANPRVSNVTEAVALHVEWVGDQPVARAQLVYIDAAVAATENGTKFQTGAVAADETLVGILRLLSAPGGAGNNDCVVTIESDADSSAGGETTQLTFATLNQASVATHEVVEAAGAITDTWWRAVVTISGAGSRTFDLIISLGVRKT